MGLGVSWERELFVSSRCCPKLAVVISGLVVVVALWLQLAAFPAQLVQVQTLAVLVVMATFKICSIPEDAAAATAVLVVVVVIVVPLFPLLLLLLLLLVTASSKSELSLPPKKSSKLSP